MRCFAISLILLQGLCADYCSGFSPVKIAPYPHNQALHATKNEVGEAFHRNVAGIAATLALGWAVGAGSSVAAPLSSNIWSPTSASSSFVVALSDSDFADFSLPSYQEVRDAEINTNLKGGKTLMKDEMSVSTASNTNTPVEQKKEPTADELKAEKAAAKAAQKAARERQQAAVEAAAAAK